MNRRLPFDPGALMAIVHWRALTDMMESESDFDPA
jgi:hypothetical protein